VEVPTSIDSLLRRTIGHGRLTASAMQVRDKVVALETRKWEPYRRYLGPLISHLAD